MFGVRGMLLQQQDGSSASRRVRKALKLAGTGGAFAVSNRYPLLNRAATPPFASEGESDPVFRSVDTEPAFEGAIGKWRWHDVRVS